MGPNDEWNRANLCTKCHARVFVEDSKSGIHSIPSSNQIILNRWFATTDGRCLVYKIGDETYLSSPIPY